MSVCWLVLPKQRDEKSWLCMSGVQCLAVGTEENASNRSNGLTLQGEFKVMVTCNGRGLTLGSMALQVDGAPLGMKCPVLCEMSASISGFCPVEAYSTSLQLWQFKTVSRCRHLLRDIRLDMSGSIPMWPGAEDFILKALIAFKMERSHVYLEELCEELEWCLWRAWL